MHPAPDAHSSNHITQYRSASPALPIHLNGYILRAYNAGYSYITAAHTGRYQPNKDLNSDGFNWMVPSLDARRSGGLRIVAGIYAV
ncbi:hypothetical protein TMatcc_005945 [Talaromyces marneffei ATCC 18224]|uniref:uncharacterized protein n=1 Tax=Talaromyces marneffei TaxID=37727 RepID=UPI0012A8A5BF|nr:uncharacterized protein EYB26_005560 [Talaromyces marneffei]QGA17884.1 hypothetical protein EYB26_005560 [Talaromyces marneffei]